MKNIFLTKQFCFKNAFTVYNIRFIVLKPLTTGHFIWVIFFRCVHHRVLIEYKVFLLLILHCHFGVTFLSLVIFAISSSCQKIFTLALTSRRLSLISLQSVIQYLEFVSEKNGEKESVYAFVHTLNWINL